MEERRTIERIILTSDGRDGALYAVIVCTDGSLGVARNGELLEDAQWESTRMNDCVVDFARRADIAELIVH